MTEPETTGTGGQGTETVGSIGARHLLLVGAGPGLGLAIAQRFAAGGYRITLIAPSTDQLENLVAELADTGAIVETIAADVSDADALGDRITALYSGQDAPGVIVYNAVVGTP